MEDYCHHFGVAITHVDGIVTDAKPHSERYPYDTCVVGAAGLRALIGVPLEEAVNRKGWASDAATQCVHIVDLALLAVRHAGQGEPTIYEILVTPSARPQRSATLRRNGDLVLSWALDREIITSEGYPDVAVSSSEFVAWVRENLDEPDQEAAIVLRRACSIAPSRGLNMDSYDRSTELREPDETCYTHQRSVAWRARRIKGSTRSTERDLD